MHHPPQTASDAGEPIDMNAGGTGTSADPVRRLLNRCEVIALFDPSGSATRLRSLLSDYYRIIDVASPADADSADLLVIASPPGAPVSSPSWPRAVWLQPDVTAEGLPGGTEVFSGEELGAAFSSRFLSSCSG